MKKLGPDLADAWKIQGYSLGQMTEKGLYGVLGDNPERGRRFVSAMSGFASRSGVATLAESFDWGSVKSVVDVGGGRGEVSMGLAERFKHLDFVVQDLKHVVEERITTNGNGVAEDDVGRRVRFEAHNYFDEQGQRDMDVYYFRYIFHNLPDESCVKLLKAQIPGKTKVDGRRLAFADSGVALKHGAHIVIQDAVIPEPQELLSPYKEKYRR